MATIVEQIRGALGKRDGISEESMRPLAASYAAEVARVNSRLETAVALLHKGLRSEAIQSASIAPNAIDDAAKLDFPDNEREDWHDILQFLDVEVPPVLNRDLVDQLNEAIIETQPLDALLKRHRQLAIARAPLAWRLKVLRRIAAADAGSGVWEEDIESWEKVRVNQLKSEVPKVIKEADPAKLHDLFDELTQPNWRVPPDPKIIAQVKTAITGIEEADTLSKLEALAPQLNDAFCEFNEAGARELLSKWNTNVQKLSTPLPRELAEQVDPAKMWLMEVDREAQSRKDQAAAVGALEAALDRKAPLEDLEKAYQQATLFDEPPPEDLIQRYWVVTEERKLSVKRRFQLMVAGVVAAALLMIGLFGWWQVNAAYKNRVAAAEGEFRKLVEAKDIESATSFYQSLQTSDPGIAASSSLVSLSGQLSSLIDEENDRASQFNQYLAAADSQDDGKIDVSALSRAEALAVSEEEKGRAYVVRRRYSQWENRIATEHTQQMLERLKSVRERLDVVESGDPNEVAMQKIAKVLDDLQGLPKVFPRASSSARTQVASARSRAISLRSAISKRSQRMQAEMSAMKEIRAATNLDSLAESLEAFADKSPDSPMADEFLQAAGERDLWDKALAWNQYVSGIAKALSTELTSEKSQEVVAAAAVLDAQVGDNPMSLPTSVTERFTRYTDRSAILERVLGDLPNTVIADLFTVVESRGKGKRHFVYKSYYDKERTRKFGSNSRGKIGVEVVANDSGAVKTKSMVGGFVIHKEPYDTVKRFVSDYEVRHNQILADWDGELVKLTADLRKRPNLDGLVKEMLMQHLLTGGCEGSDYLSKNLTSDLQWMKSRTDDVSLWYEAAQPNTQLHSKIEETLIPKLGKLYKRRSTPRSEFAAIRSMVYRQVGVLVRRDDGRVEVLVTQTPAEDCRLAIIRPSAREEDKVDWVSVGKFTSGRASLTGLRQDLIAGRPVFSFPK